MAARHPLLTQVVPPFTLTVFYDGPPLFRYRLVVQHESEEETRAQDFVDCTYEPLFGIDVGDMADIRAKAERMCRDLEAMRR